MNVVEDIPLVWKIAWQYKLRLPYYVEIDDLVGDGCVGLVRAGQSYNSSFGVPFVNYAGIRIQSAIRDGLRRMDCVTRWDRKHHPFEVVHVSLSWHPRAADSVASHDLAQECVARLDAEKAVARLPERSARIIRAYYLDGLTLRAIGDELGIGESRACLIKSKALALLRVDLGAR